MLPVFVYLFASHIHRSRARESAILRGTAFFSEGSAQLERHRAGRFVFVCGAALRVFGRYPAGNRVVERVKRHWKLLFGLIVTVHKLALYLREVVYALFINAVLPLALRRADDKKARADGQNHEYSGSPVDVARVGRIFLPIAPEVGEEVHKASTSHQQHHEDLEQEGGSQLSSGEEGVEKDNEVDDNGRAGKKDGQKERPAADPDFVPARVSGYVATMRLAIA